MDETTDYSFNDKSIYTFASSSKNQQKIVPFSEHLQLSIPVEDKSCRICLDTSIPNTNFIQPCKCSGSVKYVHEECLKTWLVSLSKDLSNSTCEICHTKYLMKIEIKRKCKPREACEAGAAHCLFIPILLAVNVMLFIIVYLLASKYFNESSSDEQKGYTIALTGICLIAEVVIMVLVFKSIKEACYGAQMNEWQILDQEFEERVVDEEGVKRFEEIRTKTLVMPKKSVVNGVNVRVPRLRPLMTPVFRSERVGFSPQYMTPCQRGDRTSIHDLNESEIGESVFKY